MKKEKGLLIVVSAPSGCGKGTILGEILKDDRFYYSVSATTRQPREGEVDGVNYRFMTEEQFEAYIEEDAFLEHAIYNKNRYGTLRAPIVENRAAGKHVILEIEVKGAAQIRSLCPDAVFVFIVPPSIEVLRERLTGRGTEKPEVIAERVMIAEEEMTHANEYDYVIVNDKLDEAIADFKSIIRAEECRTKK